MTRLLLGVLDKATLRLGDNTTVNFERTLIFLTSNLGAHAMRKEMAPDFGFEAMVPLTSNGRSGRLQSIGKTAVRRRFPPEFINRIDAVITYQPLTAASLEAILDQQIGNLQRHISNRLDEKAFEIEVTRAARKILLRKGTSEEYGARELKRTILRELTQPLAALVAGSKIDPGAIVRAGASSDGDGLDFVIEN